MLISEIREIFRKLADEFNDGSAPQHWALKGAEMPSLVLLRLAALIAEGGEASGQKLTTLRARRGRDDGVQMELNIDTHFDSGRRAYSCASVEIDPAIWQALVEFVKEKRSIKL